MISEQKIPSLKQDILSTVKGFHKNESPNCLQQAIQRLLETTELEEDVSEMVKSN